MVARNDDKVNVAWINHKNLYSDMFLDQEIEIEEDKTDDR